MAKAQAKAAALAETTAGTETDIDVAVQQHGFSGQTCEIKLFKGELHEPQQPFFGLNNYQIQIQRERWVRVPVEMADHIEGLAYTVREADPEEPENIDKMRWVEKPRFPPATQELSGEGAHHEFLQLARAVKRESGLSGGPPASATTASGDDARVFEWVNWAWRDIALAHESWLFRRGEALGQVAAGALLMVPEAAAPGFALADFAAWKPAADGYRPSAWRVADGQVSEHALAWLDYEAFRQRYLVGVHAPGALQCWSIAPGGELLVGPTPDAAHMVRAAYVKDVVDMVLDADEPALPARFHNLIGWRALREYGGFDAASEVYQRAEQNYSMGFSALAQSQLPRPGFGARPLA